MDCHICYDHCAPVQCPRSSSRAIKWTLLVKSSLIWLAYSFSSFCNLWSLSKNLLSNTVFTVSQLLPVKASPLLEVHLARCLAAPLHTRWGQKIEPAEKNPTYSTSNYHEEPDIKVICVRPVLAGGSTSLHPVSEVLRALLTTHHQYRFCSAVSLSCGASINRQLKHRFLQD